MKVEPYWSTPTSPSCISGTEGFLLPYTVHRFLPESGDPGSIGEEVWLMTVMEIGGEIP